MLGFIFSTKHKNGNKTPIMIPTFLKSAYVKLYLAKLNFACKWKPSKNSARLRNKTFSTL